MRNPYDLPGSKRIPGVDYPMPAKPAAPGMRGHVDEIAPDRFRPRFTIGNTIFPAGPVQLSRREAIQWLREEAAKREIGLLVEGN